jgi:hypothetical protein
LDTDERWYVTLQHQVLRIFLPKIQKRFASAAHRSIKTSSRYEPKQILFTQNRNGAKNCLRTDISISDLDKSINRNGSRWSMAARKPRTF